MLPGRAHPGVADSGFASQPGLLGGSASLPGEDEDGAFTSSQPPSPSKWDPVCCEPQRLFCNLAQQGEKWPLLNRFLSVLLVKTSLSADANVVIKIFLFCTNESKLLWGNSHSL